MIFIKSHKLLNIILYINAMCIIGGTVVHLISGKYIKGFIPLSMATFFVFYHIDLNKKLTKSQRIALIVLSIIFAILGIVQIFYK